MRILKANTAVRLVVGPLCDKTTGLAKPSMTVTNMAMNMWHEHDDGSAPTKSIDAVAFTASGGSNDMVELAGGYYDIEITAAQLNITAGRASFCIYDDDVILPYFEEWLVVPANVFDSLMGTDYLDVNARELGGTSQTGNDVGADVNDILADTGTDGVLVSSGTGAKQISLSSGAVILQSGTGTGQLDFTSGVVKANLAQILGTALTETAGQIAAAFKRFFNVAGTGTLTMDSIPTNTADAVWGADFSNYNGAEEAGGELDTAIANIASILADTGTDGVKIADDAITAAKFDESTAFPVKSADTGATQIARVGADSDTLETLSDQMDAIKTETASILEDTGTTLPATLASILEDTGTTLPAAIIAGSAGSGATAKVYTITDSVTGLPIEGVDTWATTDLAGSNIVAYAKSNASGQVTLYLNSGTTYYIWRAKYGYTFTNPDTEVA